MSASMTARSPFRIHCQNLAMPVGPGSGSGVPSVGGVLERVRVDPRLAVGVADGALVSLGVRLGVDVGLAVGVSVAVGVGVGVGVPSSALSSPRARAASTRPAPDLVSGSPISSAVCFINRRISLREWPPAARCAATPAAWGQAMDVPEREL